jgi:hypothetical protein
MGRSAQFVTETAESCDAADGSIRFMAPPTVRQIYALAAALCERSGEQFPATREAASETIERIRDEIGHPAPRPGDTPACRRGDRRSGRGTRKLARAIAAEVARELR